MGAADPCCIGTVTVCAQRGQCKEPDQQKFMEVGKELVSYDKDFICLLREYLENL